ncbi:2-oxoglutarate dehydrogenase E1 component [Ferrovibrio sp.]|uniref:2-oxoglutarate dehydrogenase E1 component n=1 Tax=Ferrovibrio sp. TaxID=1917215 RepID=UPI001B516282|nr:2-oxoglutarate dehydrogenase E1 component [Ferrovibrio sp.]MBP7063457.1 2-oxoglutarate dehydrogenase E1 component [Ferrovibrio sp.]
MTAQLERTQFLYGGNSSFVEELYGKFVADPNSVDASWREFFAALGEGFAQPADAKTRPSWQPVAPLVQLDDEGLLGNQGKAAKAADKALKAGASAADARAAALDTIRAAMLIRNYRIRGHLMANLDPLGIQAPGAHPELEPATYGFSEADMDRPIFIDFMLGLETASLREILAILRRTYCSTIGVEFMHIYHQEQKAWIQARIEGRDKEVHFTPEGKRAILNKLVEAEIFERFCHMKFTGTKRFGLEGGEALIPALEAIIKRGGQMGLLDIELGMPHRGRLNLLANVMAKPYRAIFSEFKGMAYHPDDFQGSGDVKYHLGVSSDREFDGNKVHLSLAANPSHLEIINPVCLGKSRAKQTQLGDTERGQVMTVLLHGDAAFAGQGVVAECFALSELRGYRTGGTIHIIVNNQIGFTTNPSYSRSSPYPSDGAKVVQAPIFHVNGDDPEAVTHVAKIATEFRQTFKKDVVIDLFCYRRHGHNETDDPSFTQPVMYRTIATHPTTRQLYSKRLVDEGTLSEAEAEAMVTNFQNRLEEELEASKSFKPNKADWLEGKWSGLEVASGDDRRGSTAVELDVLRQVGAAITTVPEGFNIHKTLTRQLATKKAMIDNGEGIDWATAEALAFGSLQLEGHGVRLSGQDCGRGTFSQRHSVWHDQQTEERYVPLNNLGAGAANYEVIDSLLSEVAVLGYDYGYSLADPNTLTIWEGQFGDFANGAQVVVDQFISSGEAKWMRMSGLVMLLPHGYEGQGPEHSSARLERYLQLCAEDNMQVANCSTPANYFHILRRQLKRNFRKPLVLMTPKSLLRHKLAVSKLSEMGPGSSFHRVLWDDNQPSADEKIKRVILCTGKVYYDLFEEREKRGLKDTVILRIEQLYPFPHKALAAELGRYKNAKLVVWAQEEPKNMGAWSYIQPYLEAVLADSGLKPKRPVYAGRVEAASPATGLMSKHNQQQAKLVDDALTAS